MSLSLNSLIETISLFAPLTFIAAASAAVIGNVLARRLRRKKEDEIHSMLAKHLALTEPLEDVSEIENITQRIAKKHREMGELMAHLELIQASAENLSPSTSERKLTDVLAKIGEYLSNNDPVDSPLKEVAK
jgi:hypothetical protein